MIVKWTTAEGIIAKVVRNLRTVDKDLLVELPAWIAEAVGLLKTTYQLEFRYQDVKVKFHKACMPCNMEGFAAVTHNGCRLLPGDPAGPMNVTRHNIYQTMYQSVVRLPASIKDIEETDINNYPFYLSSVEALKNMPVNDMERYKINYNKLELSFESGTVRVYYWTAPMAENGLPIVPDNENYTNAVYWYCRMMIIGTGYKDPVFTYNDCEEKWERIGRRAINEITYPTVDEKVKNIMNNVRLIPQDYAWENFSNGVPEGSYNDDL